MIGCATVPRLRFFQANEELRAAELQPKNYSRAIGLYLSAAHNALAIITDKNVSPQEEAKYIQIYNDAVERCALALQQNYSDGKKLGLVFQDAGNRYKLYENPSETTKKFSSFILSKKIDHRGYLSNIKREGLGGSLVGILDNQKTPVFNRPSSGFAEPITVIASFGKKSSVGDIPVTLSFFDPRVKETVVIEKKDFSSQ